MSNAPAKPFLVQHAVPAGVTSTRWWWVRHAPVRTDGGNIYGQFDIDCDCSDSVVFAGVAKFLPRDAVWFSSNLKRTHQTAAAIWAAGLPKPDQMHQDKAFAEQLLTDHKYKPFRDGVIAAARRVQQGVKAAEEALEGNSAASSDGSETGEATAKA